MAQEAEHFLGKEEVTGSNPVSSSNDSVHAGVRNFYLFTINYSLFIKNIYKI